MLADPFATAACARTVGPFEALLRGVPDGACLEFALTPLTAFVVICAIGITIACLQAMARALVYGRMNPDGPRRPHEPDLSLREAANRARAARRPD